MLISIFFGLFIFISCLDLNKYDDFFNMVMKYLHINLDNEKDNFNQLHKSSEDYLQKIKNQENYLQFIKDINNNFYYPLNKKKTSLLLNLMFIPNLINSENCHSYHLVIGNNKNKYLLCINSLYNMLSLHNLTSEEEYYKNITRIPLSLNLNYSYPIHVSFSAFDEEQTKIYFFNNKNVFSVLLKFNFFLDNITISNTKNFTIPKSKIITDLELNQTTDSDIDDMDMDDDDLDDDLIYLSTTLYHGNRYIIYGYSTGEIKIYLIKDKTKDSFISVRTTFNLHKTINKIYQIQGYLFVVTDNKKKINVLSLLGSNSILVNCYNFNEIIDLVFEYKKNLLYILDSKGNIIIKELVLSVSKAYSNTCNNIYYLQIPKFIAQRHNKLNKKLSLIMTKDLNTIYIMGSNYLGYINTKFNLENYLIYNQYNNNNYLEDNDSIFIKGSLTFLLANYNKKLLIYEIKYITNDDAKKDNKEKSNKINSKDTPLYNTIDDNSGIVECNGNVICKLLFNSITNNKYTINTLYITCIIIIFTTVYHFNKNKNDKSRKFKTFKEDNYNSKENNDKLAEMLKQIKNMDKLENFSDYKKRQRENENKSNIRTNKFFEDEGDDAYKDYYGDDDENENDNDLNDNDKEQNSEEFLEKAYHNYVSDMMKKEKRKNMNDYEMSEDEENEYENDENNINNIDNNNRNINRFEERKDQSSQEGSEEERLNNEE